MEKEEIKEQCEEMYRQINESEITIKALRELCPHEVTHEGLYSYRVGAIHNATICSHCGSCVKLHIPQWQQQS